MIFVPIKSMNIINWASSAAISRTTASQMAPMLMSDSAFAGSVSGIAARLITTPLDVIKIRFQLQLEPIKFSVNENGRESCVFVLCQW